MEKHLSYPGHPKFEPQKWNKNKYIKHSHNCYTYALNTIIKKNVKTCKKYANLSKKKRKTLKQKLKKMCVKNFNTWGWCDYHKPDKCAFIRPQTGLYKKTIKKYNKKNHPSNIRTLSKLLLKDNPKIKKLRKNQTPPLGYYRIYLIPTFYTKFKKGDYHFLRQDNTGSWSEKWGDGPAKKIKEKTPEEYLKNLKKNMRSSLVFKGDYFAVPIKGKKNFRNFMKEI